MRALWRLLTATAEAQYADRRFLTEATAHDPAHRPPRLRPPHIPEEPALQELEWDTHRLQGAVPVIKEIRFGRNVTLRADPRDCALVALQADEAAPAHYLGHPAHREVPARWTAVNDAPSPTCTRPRPPTKRSGFPWTSSPSI
ncbi:hypothetical protein [Streptomyces lavendofoliae]|uniref:hypothetical protein n=1 Tax=Streptomyces lavendofoliae TaxID=67314 RepID=UPI00300F306D